MSDQLSRGTVKPVRQALPRGIYETEYGNAALVSGRPNARTAYDLDMGEYIPIALVTRKYIRAAEPSDKPYRG